MPSLRCRLPSQSGLYSNHADIGPRYAGVLLGLSNTAGVLAGVLGTAATGFILQNGSWKQVGSRVQGWHGRPAVAGLWRCAVAPSGNSRSLTLAATWCCHSRMLARQGQAIQSSRGNAAAPLPPAGVGCGCGALLGGHRGVEPVCHW